VLTAGIIRKVVSFLNEELRIVLCDVDRAARVLDAGMPALGPIHCIVHLLATVPKSRLALFQANLLKMLQWAIGKTCYVLDGEKLLRGISAAGRADIARALVDATLDTGVTLPGWSVGMGMAAIAANKPAFILATLPHGLPRGDSGELACAAIRAGITDALATLLDAALDPPIECGALAVEAAASMQPWSDQGLDFCTAGAYYKSPTWSAWRRPEAT
jgi:hypothetical protein